MDITEESPLWLLQTFWFITSKIFLAYSLTQKYSITDQLKRGVRYLDLRVGQRPEDGNLYVVHSFYGNKVEVILTQVAEFLEEHSMEVVVIDFQHVHNLNRYAPHLSSLTTIKLSSSLPLQVPKTTHD